MTQDLAGQAAQARMQEQLAARQQLAGVLGQARAQELQGRQFDVGQFNQRQLRQAMMGQEVSLANQRAILQNRAQQNQFGLGLRELELRNAAEQAAGLRGFAGTQQPNQFGTQLLSGGGALLANQFGNMPGGAPQQPQTQALQFQTMPGLQTGAFGRSPFSEAYGFGSGVMPGTGALGASQPVNLAGSGITGQQTGFALPRL
jgi:hypothetical protein